MASLEFSAASLSPSSELVWTKKLSLETILHLTYKCPKVFQFDNENISSSLKLFYGS